MNFVLFLLLNAVLLIRPEEFFPDIAGLRLYLITIVLCTLTSLPRLQELLSLRSLQYRPVEVCIILLLASTILSLCMRGRISEALLDFGPEFAKVVLYYFLLIAIIDTPSRFRAFITAIVLLVVVLTSIALAQFYGVADFPNIVPCIDKATDPLTGEEVPFPRMVSSGIFNDPNDLCLILGLGILCCIYGATTTTTGFASRLLWFAPIPLFAFSILQTHSRGGLLGVLAGGAAYLFSRYGGPKSIPYAVGGVVAALLAIGGRQGSISGGGTAHERLMFWAQGLTELFSQPVYLLTGLGNGWFVNENGLVAHNSFVQAYVELGIIGGGAFIGAFYLAARIIYGFGQGIKAPSWIIHARHFGFASVIGYAVGCFSITRNFIVPTYLTLGIASALLDKAATNLPEKFQVDGKWFGWAILLSVCGLLLMKIVTQSLCSIMN